MTPGSSTRPLWRIGLILAVALSVMTVSLGRSPVAQASATNDTTVTPGPAWSSAVGVSHTQTIAHWFDADNAPEPYDLTITVTWGDGTADSCVLNPTGTTCTNPASAVHLASCNAAGENCDIIGTHTYSAAGTYTITTTVHDPDQTTPDISTSITATVGGGSSTNLQKTVDGYFCPASQGCTATPGERLTYRIRFTPQAAVTSATITDVIQPWQSLSALSSNCSSTTSASGTVTVTCTVSTVGAGQTAVSTIITTVTGSPGSVITNQASVGATSTTGAATSNTTSVTVAGTPAPRPNVFTICGPTTSTATTITVAGNTFPLAGGVVFTGVQGGNYCVTLTFSNGVVTSIVYTQNLAAPVRYVCGPFITITTTTITIGGFAFVSSMTTTSVTFTPGVSYCFVIDATGRIVAVLSTVPTSAVPARDHYRIGRLIAY